MSKAFTRESDDATDEPAPASSRASQLPPGAKNYMTPAGARRFRAEVDRLANAERAEALRDIAVAEASGAGAGDARRNLQRIDQRIADLGALLEAIEVVEPAAQDPSRVLFGATVTVRDEHDAEVTYRVVGVDETDPKHGAVSWTSPVARALLNSRVGDVVTLRTPRGEEELEVVRITYGDPDENEAPASAPTR